MRRGRRQYKVGHLHEKGRRQYKLGHLSEKG